MNTFVVVGGHRGQLGSRLTQALALQNGTGVLGWDTRSGSGLWHDPDANQPQTILDYENAQDATRGHRLAGVVALNGRFRSTPFLEESPSSQEEIFSSNYFSVAHLLQQWIPHMVATGGGTFITLSTMGVATPYGGATSYVASKGALLALTRALDRELHPDGIRGHCIVAGPMSDDANPSGAGTVAYMTVVNAICGLLRTPESGTSYLPVITPALDAP